jgi:hypothetical protein
MSAHRQGAVLLFSDRRPRRPPSALPLAQAAAVSFFAGTLLLAAGAAHAGQVAAESGKAAWPTGQVRFDIPSQPLTAALEAYSTTSGVQVLYDSRLARNRRSDQVVGVYTPEAALKILIAGTDLVVRYTKLNDIVLVLAPKEDKGPARAPVDERTVLSLDTLRVEEEEGRGAAPFDYRAYVGVVQADIQAALRRNAETRSGNYSIGVRLWLDPAGNIRRSNIFRSSGNQQRDVAISRVLQDVTISKAPPTNMPQPVTILIIALPL